MTLRERLKAALPVAMKARDAATVTALRSALAAIENAAAVVPPAGSDRRTADGLGADGLGADGLGADGLGAVGLAVTEVARRDQDDAEIERIVRAEITDRLSAAAEYDGLGRTDRAGRLRAEAQALVTHLTDQ